MLREEYEEWGENHCPYLVKLQLKEIRCDCGTRISFPTVAECRRYYQENCCDPDEGCNYAEHRKEPVNR